MAPYRGKPVAVNLFGWPTRFAALARDVLPNGGGLHAALGGGNTMPLTAFCGADGGLLAAESAVWSRSAP
jgi:hypothetical protein